MSDRAPHEDPMWSQWQAKASSVYDKVYYELNGLVAHINNAGHRIIEQAFGPEVEFASVVEVGAGTGRHLPFVRHRFQKYVATDLRLIECSRLRRASSGRGPESTFKPQDATRLDFEDNSFDRLISVYNLEHLPGN